MTKKILMKELESANTTIYRLKRQNNKLRSINNGLYRANLALGEEVNFLNDKIDRAIALIEARQRARKGPPAWLKEIIRET
jgi:hypothetical protein